MVGGSSGPFVALSPSGRAALQRRIEPGGFVSKKEFEDHF
jgi:hypothetical protein